MNPEPEMIHGLPVGLTMKLMHDGTWFCYVDAIHIRSCDHGHFKTATIDEAIDSYRNGLKKWGGLNND